jgi:hypothetical protein
MIDVLLSAAILAIAAITLFFAWRQFRWWSLLLGVVVVVVVLSFFRAPADDDPGGDPASLTPALR